MGGDGSGVGKFRPHQKRALESIPIETMAKVMGLRRCSGCRSYPIWLEILYIVFYLFNKCSSA